MDEGAAQFYILSTETRFIYCPWRDIELRQVAVSSHPSHFDQGPASSAATAVKLRNTQYFLPLETAKRSEHFHWHRRRLMCSGTIVSPLDSVISHYLRKYFLQVNTLHHCYNTFFGVSPTSLSHKHTTKWLREIIYTLSTIRALSAAPGKLLCESRPNSVPKKATTIPLSVSTTMQGLAKFRRDFAE